MEIVLPTFATKNNLRGLLAGLCLTVALPAFAGKTLDAIKSRGELVVGDGEHDGDGLAQADIAVPEPPGSVECEVCAQGDQRRGQSVDRPGDPAHMTERAERAEDESEEEVDHTVTCWSARAPPEPRLLETSARSGRSRTVRGDDPS